MSPHRSLREPLLSPSQIEAGIKLPTVDVRQALDNAVRRGWAEHTRRLFRIVILLIGDTVAGMIGVLAVLQTWFVVSNDGLRPVPDATPLIATVICIQPLALRVFGAYGGGRTRVDLGRIAGAFAIAATVGWIQARLFGQLSPDLPNKTAYTYFAILGTATVWIWRIAFDQAVKSGFKAGLLQRRVLVVGHRGDVEPIQRQIDHARASDARIVGALSPTALETDPLALAAAIERYGANAVVIAANLPFTVLERLISRCFQSGVSVSLLPKGLQELRSSYVELRESSAGLLLRVLPLHFGLPQLAVKRTVDVLLTSAGLLVIWPLLVLIAAAIKLDSPGPVFFSQERVGVGGRRFKMLKFRTMIVGADAMKASLQHLNEYPDARLFKIKDDPRVTRLGRFLRKSSLDELPQLWNVLRGDMSLVGPRPCVPQELEHYAEHHLERLFVLPGVTGPWQVNGRNAITDFEEVVRLDREYIRSWSLVRDLSILVRTIPSLFRRGAY